MKFKNLTLLFLIGFIISNCTTNNSTLTIDRDYTIKYSFFVAGHTYGSPLYNHFGLHPPFVKHIPNINKIPKIEFGILTGDIVREPTNEYWDSARYNINQLKMPIHIAAGNHDRGPIFDSLYNSYYQFTNTNDLFIILSPSNWNIENNQLDFLRKTLSLHAKSAANIYIFAHELIWWSPDNEFNNIIINYLPHYPGQSNFESEILPILDSLDNEIYIFAGDLGCTPVVTPYMYHKKNNMTYIASGMGNYEKDNIILVEVDMTGLPHFRLIGLNQENLYEIEPLDKFKLP